MTIKVYNKLFVAMLLAISGNLIAQPQPKNFAPSIVFNGKRTKLTLSTNEIKAITAKLKKNPQISEDLNTLSKKIKNEPNSLSTEIEKFSLLFEELKEAKKSNK